MEFDAEMLRSEVPAAGASNNNAPSTETEETQSEYLGPRNGFKYRGLYLDGLRKEDFVGLEFKSLELAEEFYMGYSKAIEFSVRNDIVSYNSQGKVSRRRWFCSKEGERDENSSDLAKVRPPKPLTRESCPAFFLANYIKKRDVYIVKDFNQEHSHALATPLELPYLRSHWVIQNLDLAQATGMCRVLARTCHTYEYMVDQSGGYVNVGFQIKELYNKLDSTRREILLEGDAEAALAYLKAKAAIDPEFFCKFSVDEDSRLVNLFWRDSNSLLDNLAFGDVLMLDSTYKTNTYEKPLVLLVGSNHHRLTVIFGFALVADETFDTYTWVLETFLSSMKGNKPMLVLMDGDEAMRKAINKVFSESNHQLCSWHLHRNALSNLKELELVKDFETCLWDPFVVDEFEKSWQKLKERATPIQKQWLATMYDKRETWAEAFFRGKFFGGMCTTQRVEFMNKFVKDYLKKGVKLFELIPALDRAMLRLKNNVAKEDFNTKNSKQVLTTQLTKLEQHAANIFTPKVLKMVHHERTALSALITRQIYPHYGGRLYRIEKYGEQNNEWTYVYHKEESYTRIDCSCKKFPSDGIPCCHLFYVIKCEHLTEIPSPLIMKRWTKAGRSDLESTHPADGGGKEVIQTARYGSLSASLNKLSFFGSRTEDGYVLLKNEMSRLEAMLEGIWKKEEETSLKLGRDEECPKNILKDPKIVKTKGTQGSQGGKRKRRKCSVCGVYGHTMHNCSQRNLHPSRNANMDDTYASESNDPMNNIGPSPDISYSYASKTISQTTSNYIVNLSSQDDLNTGSSASRYNNYGFSFSTGERVEPSISGTQNSELYQSWFSNCSN